MAELDMENRDPNGLNAHIRAAFEDVLAEPESAHSIDCVWVNSYKCFTCARNCCYKLVTTLCGLCMAFFWGCDFACTAIDHVWCITPCMRGFSISVGALQKFWSLCVSCWLAPCCEACGACFSKIVVSNK